MNREAIYAALFARLSAIPGLVTTSRKLRHWTDVPPPEQPALFQAQGNQTAQPQTGLPPKWLLSADVYIYVRTTGADAPGPVINPILDAVTDALAPDNPVRNTCTLGGLVEWARIEGAIETDEGTLGDQAVAIIPINILAV